MNEKVKSSKILNFIQAISLVVCSVGFIISLIGIVAWCVPFDVFLFFIYPLKGLTFWLEVAFYIASIISQIMYIIRCKNAEENITKSKVVFILIIIMICVNVLFSISLFSQPFV